MKDNNRFYYKKNRLQQIRGFCATVQCGCSIRKASMILGIEHSTISLQIKSLEKDLNTELFERSKNNKMTLTKNGDLFYKKAIIHLQGIDSLFEYFNSNIEKYIENNINIACDNLTATYILPRYLSLFKQKISNFNKINININITKLEESFKKLINNDIDLALFCYVPSIKVPIEIQEENICIYNNYIISNKNNTKNCKLPNDTFNNNYSIINNSNINIDNINLSILKNLTKYNLTSYFIPEIALEETDYNNFNIKSNDLFPKTNFSIFYMKNYIKKINIKKLISIIKNNKTTK